MLALAHGRDGKRGVAKEGGKGLEALAYAWEAFKALVEDPWTQTVGILLLVWMVGSLEQSQRRIHQKLDAMADEGKKDALGKSDDGGALQGENPGGTD